MSQTITLRLAQRGILTLPKKLRQTYNLKAGDSFTLLDLDGVFILSPKLTQIDALADRISDDLSQKGESLESMLRTLREEREKYNHES
ncbi:MAG: AbrB/MazE/SpoVT family DNA-binding domain-containing protein [Chloroflexi bacterium]|nr:AbrB/MazE/SpoVT family DNA-binding domain-containing protein [Chloroflexota bacterium]